MIYKKFQDLELSELGFGSMRLPIIDGDMGHVDEDGAREIVAYCMEHGINYYDTAWPYHHGAAEVVMGKILKDYPRDSFYLATKFPGLAPRLLAQREEIFESQFERCQVDYFDFYLFHDLNDGNAEEYLSNAEDGLYAYLMEQKKRGRIRHLGFSVHGDYDLTKRFLDAHREGIEFCQIQLNWIDYDFQEARRKVELLDEYEIPIWVMEPLRGGKLAKVPEKYEEELKAVRPGTTIPELGFRFLQTFPNIKVILSGMSDLEQVKQNVETFETEQPLNAEEWDALLAVAEETKNDMTVPCTGCHYCSEYCPKQIDIPRMISVYNDQVIGTDNLTVAGWMLEPIPPEDQMPGACIACRSCERVCPQDIRISEVMAKLAASINMM